MRRLVIVAHRYLGIPLSVVFVVWFVSGIVMMYTGGMPALTPEARLEHLEPLDLDRVRLEPAAAAAHAPGYGPGSQTTLLMVSGRPAYRFDHGFYGVETVFADNGAVLGALDAEAARGIASDYMDAALRDVEVAGLVTTHDQWTVGLGADLPLHRLRLRDGSGSELYVSPRTAEVVLVTTPGSRTLAWLGAIPHWFYFTPLRTNQPAWYWSVVGASAAGCALALLGLVLAVTQFRRTRPFDLSASVPYRGWMRWHYILGAIFGALSLTWVFSGLLSMEPFEWTRAEGLDVPRSALSGGDVDMAAYEIPDAAHLDALLAGRTLKELELVRILGTHHYVARTAAAGSRGVEEIVVAADSLAVREEPFPTNALLEALAAAVPDTRIAASRLLNEYDSYYYARGGEAPLPVLRVEYDDPARTWAYVDPRTGELLALTHRLRRLERWLFNGLHSLDFAFWYDRRPLWDIGVIVLSLGALAASAIGMWLGVKRLRRDTSRLVQRRRLP